MNKNNRAEFSSCVINGAVVVTVTVDAASGSVAAEVGLLSGDRAAGSASLSYLESDQAVRECAAALVDAVVSNVVRIYSGAEREDPALSRDVGGEYGQLGSSASGVSGALRRVEL